MIQITLTDKQAKLLGHACEFYARVVMRQKLAWGADENVNMKGIFGDNK